MKTVSAMIFTAGWVTILALIAHVAVVDGLVVAAIAAVAITGSIGTLAILVQEPDRPVVVVGEEPATERVTADIVTATTHTARLALPAPDREIVAGASAKTC